MTPGLPQQAGEAVAQLLHHYTDPQVVVVVLSPDRQTILEADLRPLSEITAILAAHSPTAPVSPGSSGCQPTN